MQWESESRGGAGAPRREREQDADDSVYSVDAR